jgi:hypothetical protein
MKTDGRPAAAGIEEFLTAKKSKKFLKNIPSSPSFFDFFDFAVKFEAVPKLQLWNKLVSFRNIAVFSVFQGRKSKCRCPAGRWNQACVCGIFKV